MSGPSPRISIVTPCLNGAAHLEAAMDSVLSQGYPDLEYVVVDGGSTDGSVDIIQKHAAHLAGWVSESDRGHSHALNKGFTKTTGEIMGWLNHDDLLLPGALRLLASVFGSFPEIEWLTAQPGHVDPEGAVVGAYPPRLWSRLGFLTGDYCWIQQESTYWRRGLWDRAGGYVSEDYAMAADFELWMRFFRHARLQSTYGLVGAFRFREGQRTRTSMEVYEREARAVVEKELRALAETGVPPASSGAWPPPPRLLKYDWQNLRFAGPDGTKGG
jgi:glycosyltransferase involved in cell wall biosynthesis